jgi:hypothetical protein
LSAFGRCYGWHGFTCCGSAPVANIRQSIELV